MRIRFISFALFIAFSIVALPAISGCDQLASALLYSWFQNQTGSSDNPSAPVIQSISSDQQTVTVGDSVTLTANATDPNDTPDQLSYLWYTSAGTLQTPTQMSTVWIAPNTVGEVTISLLVEDTGGNQDQATLQVNVGS